MSDWQPIKTIPAMKAVEVAKFPSDKPELGIAVVMDPESAVLMSPRPTHWRPIGPEVAK